VCSVTVTDRLAMQIGLSLVFAALAGIGGDTVSALLEHPAIVAHQAALSPL
jgi:hypothetical protein